MPKEYITAAEQIIWTQRIQKEEINARAQGKFSLRKAVKVQEVPLNFKPGHIDPSALTRATRFEPSQVGWDAQGPVAKEFKRCLSMQTAGPRERHQFPETMYQEIGWSQSHGGLPQDRSEPSGSNPSKLGLGWVQNDGHGGVMAAGRGGGSGESSASSRRPVRLPSSEGQPRGWQPRISKDGNVREGFGAPPYGTSFPTARFPPASRAASSRGGAAQGDAASSGREPAAAASSARPRGGGSTRSVGGGGGGRSASMPALVGKEEEFMQQEAALGVAMDHYRNFINRSAKNKWYRPLDNSDVSTFADCYTKCWGKQLYGKTK